MSDDKTSPDFARSLGDAIQANPLPAALIGAGFVWLLTGGRSSVKAGFHAMGDGLIARGRKHVAMRSFAEDRGDDARASFGAATPQLFGAARKNISDLLEQQPLLLGAIGLSVGAAIAAAFRPTAAEADVLGAASAGVQARAREVASAAAGQAAIVVDRVTKAIGDEATAQGLTSKDLKRSARDVGDKVASVIGDSANALKGTAADAPLTDFGEPGATALSCAG